MGEIPKKDYSHIDKLYDDWQEKQKPEGNEPDAAEKILSEENIEGLRKENQNKLRKQVETEKAIDEKKMAELRRILDKIHNGEILTDEERKLVKMPATKTVRNGIK